MGKLINFYYGWLMTYKSHSLRYELDNLVRTIEVYNLISIDDESEPIILLTDDEFKVFKTITESKTSYNIFTGNIHIRMEMSPKETVYSIHIKKHGEDWVFNVDDVNINYSTPANQTYRIFVTYDVPVLNITRAIGDSYINGTWDKYVYNTIKTLFEIINNKSEIAQFNKNYK
jgi:hypothetical protein